MPTKQRIPSGYRVLKIGSKLRHLSDKFFCQDERKWCKTLWITGTVLDAQIIRVSGNYIRHIAAKRP